MLDKRDKKQHTNISTLCLTHTHEFRGEKLVYDGHVKLELHLNSQTPLPILPKNKSNLKRPNLFKYRGDFRRFGKYFA